MDTEEILKELAQYMDNDWQSMEGPKLVDIDPIEWLRTHLTARYEQGKADAVNVRIDAQTVPASEAYDGGYTDGRRDAIEEVKIKIIANHGSYGSKSGMLGYSEKIPTGGDITRDTILGILTAISTKEEERI